MQRRNFLKLSGLGMMGLTTNGVTGYAGFEEQFADKQFRVALIGSGWYGKCDLLRLLQVVPAEVVALCDVDKPTLDAAAKLVAERQISKKEPAKYEDYRKMLANEKPEIVLVGTPDHWHALTMIAAVESGADVYVQKPIGVDVVECQAMLSAARKHQRVVQVGLQRRSTPHLIQAKKKIIDSGMIGKIGQVEICCYYGGPGIFQQEPSTPPEGFNYDFWTGPAPMRPYYDVVHYRGWRNFMEYGNGTIGDMGVHMLDLVRWFLGLGAPSRVSSSGGIYIKKGGLPNTNDTQIATFDYNDFQIIWNHRTWSEAPDPKWPWCAILYGENGILKAGLMGYEYKPYHTEDKITEEVTYELEQYPEDQTERDLEKHCAPAIRGHMKNFVSCIMDRSRPVADIEEGAISSIACILANISAELGRSLEWDQATGTIKNDDEANARLRRAYRSPWVHPEI